MTLNELMGVVLVGYPDGAIVDCWDFGKGCLRPGDHGDSLASFIVREIAETYDKYPGTSSVNVESAQQLQRAINCIDQARDNLDDVRLALEAYQDKLSSQRRKRHD